MFMDLLLCARLLCRVWLPLVNKQSKTAVMSASSEVVCASRKRELSGASL